jgi:hypothetical protein
MPGLIDMFDDGREHYYEWPPAQADAANEFDPANVVEAAYFYRVPTPDGATIQNWGASALNMMYPSYEDAMKPRAYLAYWANLFRVIQHLKGPKTLPNAAYDVTPPFMLYTERLSIPKSPLNDNAATVQYVALYVGTTALYQAKNQAQYAFDNQPMTAQLDWATQSAPTITVPEKVLFLRPGVSSVYSLWLDNDQVEPRMI